MSVANDANIPRKRLIKGGEEGVHPLFVVFFLCVILPFTFDLAGLLLSPMRIFLLLTILPLGIQLIMGKYGGFTWVDKLFIFHGVWVVVALLAVHGPSRLAFAGITAVELTGGYFLGRALIQNRAQFTMLFKVILGFLIVLTPFTIHEVLTGEQIINESLAVFGDVPLRGGSAYGRLGLERVYSVFEHPIHFGLFCSMAFANLFFLFLPNTFLSILVSLFVVGTAFTSLSSGPLLACALQLGLLIWHFMTKGAWKTLAILFIIFYVALDLASNRTPVTIMLDTVTFNKHSAWTRIFIFDYGMAAVKRSPLFGVGFNDYPKPHWLTSSVDNFWLMEAIRFGFVGAGALIGSLLLHLYKAARAPIADSRLSDLRVGYCISLFAVSLALVTVHIWGNVSVVMMFFVGAGAWIYTHDFSDDSPESEINDGPVSVSRYTRFPPREDTA